MLDWLGDIGGLAGAL
jgi:hypothetical protein